MTSSLDTEAFDLSVIPIGGVGEFGANAMIIQNASTSILIDYGLMFPSDNSKPGVDYYVNDPDALMARFPDLSAVFLTHAHEDHIGGLSFLLDRVNLPVYSLPYTAEIALARLRESGLDVDLRQASLNEPIEHEGFTFEFVGMTHSIVQACSLVIKYQGRTIVHSGDFKVDPLPEDGFPFQSERLRALGDEGVDLLIMDSTNATKNGFCPSDYEIVPDLERLMRAAPGRVFLATFSSNMPRVRRLKRLAGNLGRKIVFLGGSFRKHYQAAVETGYLALSPDVFITQKEAANLKPHQLLYVVTGSQGERGAAMMRLKEGEFQGLRLNSSDTVVFSSRTIPGNERVIALLVSDLEMRGIQVITDRTHRVHTSGHGYREDLAYLLSLLRPRHVAPIHGEFHQLLSHRKWLEQVAGPEQNVHLIEDGEVLILNREGLSRGGRISIPMTPIDGNQDLPLNRRLIKERKDMMYSGFVLVSALGLSADAGPAFQVRTYGLVEADEGIMTAYLLNVLENQDFTSGNSNPGAAIQSVVNRALRKRFRGRPVVQVVVDGQIV